MSPIRALCPLLLSLAAAGCLDPEAALPLSIEVHEDFVARTELLGEQPVYERPTSPGLGDCGVLVGDYPALFVEGDFAISSQADADAMYGKLAVTGRLAIDAAAPIDLSPLFNVRCIAGDLVVQGAGVASLEGLHALEYVGGRVAIEDVPLLRDLRGLRDLRFVRDELSVRRAPQLEDLSGLDWLGAIGHLSVGENATLVSLDGIEGLADVNGDVVVYRNALLERLDGLSGVGCVGGSIRVLDNPRLPRCAVEVWAEPLVVDGHTQSAEISGNDDAASCDG